MAGLRLDKALSAHPDIESRSQATNLIDRGLVTLNGKKTKPAHKTSLGDEINVSFEQASPLQLDPYNYKLEIVHEDEDLIVVNKASGLVVHPAAGHHSDTLVNALLHYTNRLASGFDIHRPGIVHRIDKDTSGLLVVAKTDSALRFLANQFKNKSVHRTYWCVTYGHFKEPSGTIKTHLLRHPTDRKRFASVKTTTRLAPIGKLAITHYQVKKISPAGLSLVHCQLETGRTHQIRVHLSESGHPIVADSFYCSSRRINSIKSVHVKKNLLAVPHLMLHAAELGFIHPRTKEILRFSVPWPSELHPTLRELDFL